MSTPVYRPSTLAIIAGAALWGIALFCLAAIWWWMQ